MFIVCSSLGVAAMAMAMLIDDLQNLYQTKSVVAEIENSNKKITQIIADQQELIANIQREPNMLQKIAQVLLGAKSNAEYEMTNYSAEKKIETAKRVLKANENIQKKKPKNLPKWLNRSGEKQNRIIMFTAGVGLIATSFACFCKKTENKKNNSN